MDITWMGQSCFKIKGKSSSVIIDPFDPTKMGLKLPKDLSAELLLITHGHEDHNNISAVSGDPVVIQGPGEYEVAGISVKGIHSYHDKQEGAERGVNTIYSITIDGVNILHLGDLGHPLAEEQSGEIDTSTDILMIPVGGNYTIDAEEAAKVVATLEPKVIIPMHYKLPESSADIAPVDGFLKEMGAENIEPVAKLSITKDKLPEETQVVLISKS
jgi:L-ascorbate metabolism protein UlaG (beta-lactamase superfamily)